MPEEKELQEKLRGVSQCLPPEIYLQERVAQQHVNRRQRT